MRRPELLSPAGDPEKLRFAVEYGADAVYCALGKFGLRRACGNFTPETLREGLAFAHARGKKVYLTLNATLRERELGELVSLLRETAAVCPPDAYILSDPGALDLLREVCPGAEAHLSTQQSTVNSAACLHWYRQGVRRIVLARELSLAEIRAIRKAVPRDLELEVFVHGAMCVSYSGRCLLSNYFTGRDANAGGCAQPCRWKYYLREEKRPFDVITAEQDEEGTYVFSSRDLCMIEHLSDLVEAGVDSLKIEGRVKSAYYAAVVTNAYRISLDDCLAGRPFDPALRRELESVSHREYGTGYYYAEPSSDANLVSDNRYLRDRAFLARVEAFDPATGLARCRQNNKLCLGDACNLLSPGTTGRDCTVEALYDAEMQPIPDTRHPQMPFYLPLPGAKAGDLLRARAEV